MTIDVKVDCFITSPRKIKPKIAVINGIVPNMKSVTATVVLVIEKINPVKATAKKKPPEMSVKLILKKFLKKLMPS